MTRIAPVTHRTKHQEELFFLNELIIDLKKMVLHLGHAPIDMPRLEEATQIVTKLEQCKEEIIFYR